MERFEHKVVLVTGAAQGVGLSIATRFAELGTTVILNDSNEDVLTSAIDKLLANNYKVFSHLADVSDGSEVSSMINKAIFDHKKIDVLINNAAITIKNSDNTKKRTIEIPDDEWDKVMQINLKSVFLCAKYTLPYMIEQLSGKIVNISSILGKTGCGGDKYDNFHPISSTSASHYCASKAAIISLTRSLAREVAQFNINVNAIAPGAVSNGMGQFGSEIVERMQSQIPMGKLAEQEDITNGAIFLCSEKSKYITGETLNINGGWLMD